jgi:predicted RNase H-like HicB family nuclease
MLIERRATPLFTPVPVWKRFESNTYECRVLLLPEREGGFSAIALRLPGVVSQGETLEEALANIEEAFRMTIGCYLEDDGQIPWEDVTVERTKDCQERWILVNV